MQCSTNTSTSSTNNIATANTGQFARQFWHKKLDQQVTIIHQGQLYIGEKDEAVYTLLGSCIAVCIRDIQYGFGGMNHFLLPSTNDQCKIGLGSEAARYGDWSMEMLLNGMYKMGAKKQNLEAKVFGGGSVLQSCSRDIGQKNIEFVRDFLANEKIPLVAENTGGTVSRKIYFFPGTGKVKLKQAEQNKQQSIITHEKEYMDQLNNSPVVGEIELF